jgi:hypothetical protein
MPPSALQALGGQILETRDSGHPWDESRAWLTEHKINSRSSYDLMVVNFP